MMRLQQTIQTAVTCTGIGLHSGSERTLTLKPAPEDTGVIFSRTDCDVLIPAHVSHAVVSAYSSSLEKDQVVIQTVEHLLAALAGLQVDNLYVELDGPEVPVLDGSAESFVALVRNAGIFQQARQRSYLKIVETVEIQEGDRWIRIEPAAYPMITYTMEFPHPLLPYQVFEYAYSPDAFVREIAPARTFGFLKDVEAMHANGFGRGGSLQNVIVVGEDKILNHEGLRYPNEFVRHKVLDLVGDMFLLGLPFVGHVKAYRSGHALNNRLVSTILQESNSWILVEDTSSSVEAAAVLSR